MTTPDKKNSTDYTKVLVIFIGLLVVIAAGYFGVDVSITPDGGVDVSHRDEVPDISIEGVSANSPDHVILKNNTNDQINLSGYMLKEGTKSYVFSHQSPLTLIEPQVNLTVYFVKEGHPFIANNNKLVSTAFRIQAGETIELLDPLGNAVQSKKAL